MFDFGLGTSELLLIAMVALIVVGPKELPGLLRTIGRWVGKVKALASEFQGQLDEITRESGVKEVKEKVERDIDTLSLDDLDREFAEIEKEMREQLAEGAKQPGGAKEADDEDLIEEEERPLPQTLDLDREPGETASTDSTGAEAGADAEARADAQAGAGKEGAQTSVAAQETGQESAAANSEAAHRKAPEPKKVAAGE